MESIERANQIADFLTFVQEAKRRSHENLVSSEIAEVRRINSVIESHYVDDQGKPAMYQSIESALYDDARLLVTLWHFFEQQPQRSLPAFEEMLDLEIDGLNGDRHPRKVFDRSPFGVAALIAGTVTIWMTVFQTYSGDDLSELLELVRFRSIAGLIWIIGLFVVIWYILKTHRNNRQVAFLASLRRALKLYLA